MVPLARPKSRRDASSNRLELHHVKVPGGTLLNRQRLSSLEGALLIPFVVLILAVAGVIGALSYRTGADAVDELAKHRANDILSRIELATDLHIQDSQLVLGTLKANHASGALDMTHLPSIENHLWQIAGLTESIGYVFFANSRGDFIGVERFPDGRVNVRIRDSTTDGIRHSYLAQRPGDRERIIFNQSGAYDPHTRPWYKKAVEQKNAVWSEIYVSDARGILKMTRAMPLYAKDELIGVIATDVTLTHLSDFLRGPTISKDGVAFICDSKGALIAVSTGDAPSVKVGGEEQRVAANASPNAVIRLAAGEMPGRMGANCAPRLPRPMAEYWSPPSHLARAGSIGRWRWRFRALTCWRVSPMA